eukprot:scaffold239964_cov33-Tisochrysis_lutea.AAC.2
MRWAPPHTIPLPHQPTAPVVAAALSSQHARFLDARRLWRADPPIRPTIFTGQAGETIQLCREEARGENRSASK